MLLKNESNQSISKNFIFSIIITIIVGLVNTVYPLVIGLVYNAELMGNLTILLYWVIILSIPIQNGLSPATSRYLAVSEVKDQNLLKIRLSPRPSGLGNTRGNVPQWALTWTQRKFWLDRCESPKCACIQLNLRAIQTKAMTTHLE